MPLTARRHPGGGLWGQPGKMDTGDLLLEGVSYVFLLGLNCCMEDSSSEDAHVSHLLPHHCLQQRLTSLLQFPQSVLPSL